MKKTSIIDKIKLKHVLWCFGLIFTFAIFILCWNLSFNHFFNNVYSAIKPIPSKGWTYNKPIGFNVKTKENKTYDVLILLRNNDAYAYRNLYLFVDIWKKNQHIKRDTLQYLLANAKGEWLGTGISDLKENKLILYPDFNFKDTVNYRFELRQGMREDTLKGITDIGLLLVKPDNYAKKNYN